MTASVIFDAAVKIMDEQDDAGNSMWSDTTEYQHRAVPILNMLIGECYPFSDNYKQKPGKRTAPSFIESLEEDIDLDDVLCMSVLPYGLAAHLAIDDNPRTASFCQQRYQELLSSVRNIPSDWDTVQDIYGIQSGDFGRW